MTIVVIGGGASGMAAALTASENRKNQVIVLERQAKVGRKLMATGNGRCNLSNRNICIQAYHGERPAFADYALQRFSQQDTCQWFERLGLYTVEEPSGRIYPFSDQANSVVDVLRLNLVRPNVTLKTGFEVQRIKKTQDGFCVSGMQEDIFCDRVIVACGGLAGTKLGGSMSGYRLLGKLGHRATRLRPALVQLKSGWNGIAALKGVRAECVAQIQKDGRFYAKSRGQVQFTDYGLSGPVIFEVSRDVCQDRGEWVCMLDFLPDWQEDKLLSELKRRTHTTLPVTELLTGILHNRLGRIVTQGVDIRMNGCCNELRDEQLVAVAGAVKHFEVSITEAMGMDQAQVTAGGILTEQFDPNTMESVLVPGLYACGEVLDIDGDCGGYNLQWAWSSGRLAGLSAGKDAS